MDCPKNQILVENPITSTGCCKSILSSSMVSAQKALVLNREKEEALSGVSNVRQELDYNLRKVSCNRKRKRKKKNCEDREDINDYGDSGSFSNHVMGNQYSEARQTLGNLNHDVSDACKLPQTGADNDSEGVNRPKQKKRRRKKANTQSDRCEETAIGDENRGKKILEVSHSSQCTSVCSKGIPVDVMRNVGMDMSEKETVGSQSNILQRDVEKNLRENLDFKTDNSSFLSEGTQSCQDGEGLNITGALVNSSVCSNDELKLKDAEVNGATKNCDVAMPQITVPKLRGVDSNKKLLILDINGILADIVNYKPQCCKSWLSIKNKIVILRPFCREFLEFCFERFNVGVWSSRSMKTIGRIVQYIFENLSRKLLFVWSSSQCTKTRYTTVEEKSKPLVLKELRKVWENKNNVLPWNRGRFNESNTLLVDDSPYKALRNPEHTAIFPHSYSHRNLEDSSLGAGGDVRTYLERVAEADDVQEYVAKHPFGQRPISESNASWGFYKKVRG